MDRVADSAITAPRLLLRHFLAALAYRTQKALPGAPADFGECGIAPDARTLHELLWHMTGVSGFASPTNVRRIHFIRAHLRRLREAH